MSFNDLDYTLRVEARIAKAREALQGEYVLGTIKVTLWGDHFSSDHNAPYVRGECAECGANSVMAATRWQDMRFLALAIAGGSCKRNDHVQDYDALVAESRTEEEKAGMGIAVKTPKGYVGVEHADGEVHAIDLDTLHDDMPLWREPVVCGAATGVSSDEGGRAALHRREITCWECATILG
jgi:hypothetical protein